MPFQITMIMPLKNKLKKMTNSVNRALFLEQEYDTSMTCCHIDILKLYIIGQQNKLQYNVYILFRGYFLTRLMMRFRKLAFHCALFYRG